MGATTRWQGALARLLMVASGFAGLGYQIVWTQQGALWLGHEAPAVLAVLTAFFGGLALGALTLGGRIERSARPARWYAGCEALIALWSVVLALALAPLAGWMQTLTGAQPSAAWQSAVAFVGTFVILLPATTAMGATLPAMQRWLAMRRLTGDSVAALYACNTAGACLGVLASALWLVPEVGLLRTAAVCALANLACAGGAWWLDRRLPRAVTDGAVATSDEPTPPLTAEPAPARHRLLLTLALTGCLGIGYEVLAVRVISQVAEDTVYTFALLLAVYLIGTAIGAAAWARRSAGSARTSAHDTLLSRRLLLAMACAALLGTLGLYAAAAVQQAVQGPLARTLSGWPNAGLLAALGAETALAVLAFALPTAVMGALFSQLCHQAQHAGVGLARAIGVNTLGACAAAPLFGVVLVPALGAKWALLALAGGYAVLAVIVSNESNGSTARRTRWATLVLLAAIAWLGALAPPLAFLSVPPGGQVLSYREGAMAAVSVVADAQGVARLRINNRQQEGSSATLLADGRQALLPLLLHPAPQRALFLGVGTGMTSATAAQQVGLQVDAVDLLPEVIEASARFTDRLPAGPRPALKVADARRFVRATPTRYDVVVADNFHPARSGSGSLYTVEHFGAVRARLADGGLFCQWLPLHQLDLATLRSIVRSFQAVYPDATAILATHSLETPVLGLIGRIGRVGAWPWRLADVERRIRSDARVPPPGEFGLADGWAVLGSFIAGPDALARFGAAAPLNTDDRPVVAYRAPRITYQPDTLPRDRLIELLGQVWIEPADVLGVDAPPGEAGRLAAYWQARNRFLAIGLTVRPSADAGAMLDQLREPLLGVLRLSPDFRPAREPLARLADALPADRAGEAEALKAALARLTGASPADSAPSIR